MEPNSDLVNGPTPTREVFPGSDALTGAQGANQAASGPLERPPRAAFGGRRDSTTWLFTAASIVGVVLLGLGFSKVQVAFMPPAGDEFGPLEMSQEWMLTPAPFITATPGG